MNPLSLIEKYYDKKSQAYFILVTHSTLVAAKALALAARVPHRQPDLDFIREAAMLHDIGIFLTHAPEIDCHGEKPYIQHGCLGRELLEKEGLPRHALVCERHTGVGITIADIERQGLPLPRRDMVPESIEEQIICFADCFYSKNPQKLHRERSLAKIRRNMAKFGDDKVEVVDGWIRLFGLEDEL